MQILSHFFLLTYAVATHKKHFTKAQHRFSWKNKKNINTFCFEKAHYQELLSQYAQVSLSLTLEQ